jgi:hypothetical protein
MQIPQNILSFLARKRAHIFQINLMLLLDPGSGIRDPRSEIRNLRSEIQDSRSGMDKCQDLRLGINIPDPQHLHVQFTVMDHMVSVR